MPQSKREHHQKRADKDAKLKRDPRQRPFRPTLEVIATALLGIGYMVNTSPYHRILAVWIFFAAVLLGILGAPISSTLSMLGLVPALGIAIWLTHEYSAPPPNELDNASPTPLIVQTTTATPSVSPVLTPSPTALSPTASPMSLLQSMTLEDIAAKIWDSNDSESRKDEIRKALVGMHVDWVLFFWSARQDKSSRRMEVSLFPGEEFTKKTFQIALAEFSLPLKGNERIPLLEKTNRLRVRGEIESVSEFCEVMLKNVVILPTKELDNAKELPKDDRANNSINTTNQSGGQNVIAGGDVNLAPLPREITAPDRKKFIDLAKNASKGDVTVRFVTDNDESHNFALQVRSLLSEAGYNVTPGVWPMTIFGAPVKGVQLESRDKNNPPEFAIALQQLLGQIGIEALRASGSASQGEQEVVLYVGLKP